MSLSLVAQPSSLSSHSQIIDPRPQPQSDSVDAVDVLATLESIDRPSSTAAYDDIPSLDLRPTYIPSTSSTDSTTSTSSTSLTRRPSITPRPSKESLDPIFDPPRRVSRLPPVPTIYPGYRRGEGGAGPSRRQRYFYVAVRRGHLAGVYDCWAEAEKQVLDHPSPVFKTFSTRLAAEAYVAGWEGAGRHSLPSSSPRPLREHLAMNFPSSVSLPTSSSSRPSYHSRLLSASPIPTDLPPSMPSTSSSTLRTDFGPRPSLADRPHSYRHSLVKVSSPLRQQVDDTARPPIRKTTSLMSIGGLLSPPSSPEDASKPPPQQFGRQTIGVDRGKAFRPRTMMETSTVHRPPTPPTSPPTSPMKKPQPKRTASGLWADAMTAPVESKTKAKTTPGAKTPTEDFSANAMAPKFSRSGLKKSGVVLPVSAPRSSSSSSLTSLRGQTSRSSLNSSPSLTSLNSASSASGSISSRMRRQTSSGGSQDRLASLAETSQKELRLNDEGLLALDSLSPPRPAFMRQRSSSSLSSVSSFTSAASTLASVDPIAEGDEPAVDTSRIARAEDEDGASVGDGVGAGGKDGPDELMVISCTKSDADADGSVESSSVKSGLMGTQRGGSAGKKKGGLFKRLTKAFKLEKKGVPEYERRGSL